MTVSLNGWRVPPVSLRTFPVPGANRKLTLDPTAGRLLVALAADYHRTVRPIDVGPWDEGGYCDRDARAAAGRKSNHASGTAVDLNWSQEGNGKGSFAKTFWADAKHKAAVAALKQRYGSCVQWGGDWSSRNWDPMHFEIKPGVTPAQVVALCTKLGIDVNGVRKAS